MHQDAYSRYLKSIPFKMVNIYISKSILGVTVTALWHDYRWIYYISSTEIKMQIYHRPAFERKFKAL